MELSAVIGSLATLASTASFVPQAWKVIRTREMKGISVTTYGITVIGFALWLSYGLLLRQWPLILTNTICLILSAFILIMKLFSREVRDIVANTLDFSAKNS